MTSIDSCIWQSAQNILQAQANLNKLYDAFDQIECQTPNLVVEFDDQDKPDADFIQPVWNAFYSVKRSNRQNARVVGWLTLAIQLTCLEGVEADWEFGKRAKVFVGYSAFPEFEYAWDFNAEDPNAAGYSEGCTMTKTHWIMEEDGTISWFYAIPLDQLTSTEDVRKYISEPVHSILKGDDPTNPEEVLMNIEDALCPPP